MNTQEKEKTSCCEPEKKPGLIKRLVEKLDRSMKAKADEKAKSGCCCGGGSDDKGGKCC
jgi:hypothetical protein